MARTKDVIVAVNGVVYRMSKSRWTAFLTDKAKEQAGVIGAYGAKEVITINRSLDTFSAQEAAAELALLTPPEAAPTEGTQLGAPPVAA